MDSAYVDTGWPRHRVSTTSAPTWPLGSPAHTWLMLEGDQIPELANAVRGLSAPGDHHWILRGSPDEYAGPGYQSGPLLLRLNQQLLEHYVASWGPQQIGVVLFGPEHSVDLIPTLRYARYLQTADGNRLTFRWCNLRKLEELCEAFAPEHLNRLLNPIQKMIWHSGLEADTWLQQTISVSPLPSQPPPTSFTLTSTNETALNAASHAWFMRHSCHALEQHLLANGVVVDLSNLRRQLADYDEEAGYCGFNLESDRRYYMQLRLFFPEEPFVKDRVIYDLLIETQIQGRQRLMAINERLLDISSPLQSGDA